MKPGRSAAALAAGTEFHSGDALQIALTNDSEGRHHDVVVVGSVRDRSLLVTQPQRAGRPVELEEGAGVEARFFMRNQALGFRSSVLKACTSPYPYVHLSYPSKIEPLKERQTTRVRSALAASVRRDKRLQAEPDTPGIIRDVSTLGAMLLTPVPIGTEDDVLSVEFRLPLNQLGDHPVTVQATIRNAHEESGVQGPWRHRYGVSFGVLDPQAAILLRAYLYERFAGD